MPRLTLSAQKFAGSLARTAGSKAGLTRLTSGLEVLGDALTLIAAWAYAAHVMNATTRAASTYSGPSRITSLGNTNMPSPTPGQKPGQTGA